MLSFKEAQQVVIEQAHSFGEELIHLDDAYGRVVASSVKADRDYPPFNRSSMDGYAIKKTDWDNGIREFFITETIFAGKLNAGIIRTGECYKIMTGAAVPADADIVLRREDIGENEKTITIGSGELRSFQNISRQGEDIKQGSFIINERRRCTTPLIGLLASLGQGMVAVQKLPRVAIITTGDEIVGINDPLTTVQIRNSNRYMIQSLLQQWKIIPVSVKHVPDNIIALQQAITAAKNNDILILNGGVSAGDADYVPGMLAQCGAQQLFHKVAIKPGKPLWFGTFPNGAIVFALPGNPLSCMVTFKLFIELFLSYSFGLGTPEILLLPFNGTREKKSSLDEFFPVKIAGTPSSLEALGFNGSGDIKAIMSAAGVARHPGHIATLTPGTMIEFYKLS